jgi:hypothetical protein
MRALLLSIAVACLSLSVTADAQLYGITPYQNGPAPDQGSVFVYDPDTLTWLDSVSLQSNVAAVLSGSGLAVHPVLPPPNDALNGKL